MNLSYYFKNNYTILFVILKCPAITNGNNYRRILLQPICCYYLSFLGFGTINSTLHVPITPNAINNIRTWRFSITAKAEMLIIVHIQMMETAFVFPTDSFLFLENAGCKVPTISNGAERHATVWNYCRKAMNSIIKTVLSAIRVQKYR